MSKQRYTTKEVLQTPSMLDPPLFLAQLSDKRTLYIHFSDKPSVCLVVNLFKIGSNILSFINHFFQQRCVNIPFTVLELIKLALQVNGRLLTFLLLPTDSGNGAQRAL